MAVPNTNQIGSNGSFKQTHHQEFKFIIQLKKSSILKGNWKEYSDKTEQHIIENYRNL